jgi:hypothetical protein
LVQEKSEFLDKGLKIDFLPRIVWISDVENGSVKSYQFYDGDIDAFDIESWLWENGLGLPL